MSFEYLYCARCVRVVDGDTVDLELDLGFHLRATLRFRLLEIDAAELSADPGEWVSATAATEMLRRLLGTGTAPPVMEGLPNTGRMLPAFPLTIETHKADSFGRWLARVRFPRTDGTYGDASTTLLELGLVKARNGK